MVFPTLSSWPQFNVLLGVLGLTSVLGTAVVLLKPISEPTPLVEQPRTPEEIQAAYDADRSRVWVEPLILALVAAMFAALVGFVRWIEESAQRRVLPAFAGELIALICLLLAPPAVACVIRDRRKHRRQSAKAASRPAPDPTESSLTLLNRNTETLGLGMVIGCALLLLVVPLVLALRPRGVSFFFFPMIVVFPVGFVLGRFLAPWLRPALPKEHPVFLEAKRMGELHGIRIRRIELVDATGVGALHEPGGVIAVTKGLLDNLEPAEVNAIVARQIGHIRARSGLRRNLLLIGLFAALMVTFWAVELWAPKTTKRWVEVAMIGVFPLLGGYLLSLLTAPEARRSEYAADAFAVQMVGNADVVIAALTKLTDLNGSPHRLLPADEKWRSEPSLENRIYAIRCGRFSTSHSDV